MLCPKRVQYVMRCNSNCGIMALLDVVKGTAFIFDAFKAADIFLSLRIAYRSVPPSLNTQ